MVNFRDFGEFRTYKGNHWLLCLFGTACQVRYNSYDQEYRNNVMALSLHPEKVNAKVVLAHKKNADLQKPAFFLFTLLSSILEEAHLGWL